MLSSIKPDTEEDDEERRDPMNRPGLVSNTHHRHLPQLRQHQLSHLRQRSSNLNGINDSPETTHRPLQNRPAPSNLHLQPSLNSNPPRSSPPPGQYPSYSNHSPLNIRKRSAQAPASSSLSSPTSSSSEYPIKRAASEPLPRDQFDPSSHLHTSSVKLAISKMKTIDSAPSSPKSVSFHEVNPLSSMLGALNLEVYIYLGTIVDEGDLIRLACCSSVLRRALIQAQFLWAQQLTVDLATADMADKIKKLYLERTQTSSSIASPSNSPLPVNSGSPSTSGAGRHHSTYISRWYRKKKSKVRLLALRRLLIRLNAPRLSFDPSSNKVTILPDELYWNSQLILFNLKTIKELMHHPLRKSNSITRQGHSPEIDRLGYDQEEEAEAEGLQSLDVRIDGQFEQTLTAAHEAWLLAQTPWARTLREFRFWVGFGLTRIPSFTLIALSTWMPKLETLDIRIGSLNQNVQSSQHHQQQIQQILKRQKTEGITLGLTDLSELNLNHLKSAHMKSCNLSKLSLNGSNFSFNHNHHHLSLRSLILPIQFNRLKCLTFKNVIWSCWGNGRRMFFELIRRCSEHLESLKLIHFYLDQDHLHEEELVGGAEEDDEEIDSGQDWSFHWDNNEEEMSEISSEDERVTLKSPPINLPNLRELILIGEGTPHIWSMSTGWSTILTTKSLGGGSATGVECSIQSPVMKMFNLKKCICDGIDLEEEEHCLLDLSDLAPNLKELTIKNCILRDEVDLYHCIRCLPELELLDLRMTENITSNLINALALSVPNLRYLDVRGCPYVQITSVARLAETIRDSSDQSRRIELIGVDQPVKPNFDFTMIQEDSIKNEVWNMYQAWSWLEFTHELLDQVEYKELTKGRKDKQRMNHLYLIDPHHYQYPPHQQNHYQPPQPHPHLNLHHDAHYHSNDSRIEDDDDDDEAEEEEEDDDDEVEEEEDGEDEDEDEAEGDEENEDGSKVIERHSLDVRRAAPNHVHHHSNRECGPRIKLTCKSSPNQLASQPHPFPQPTTLPSPPPPPPSTPHTELASQVMTATMKKIMQSNERVEQ